MMAPRIRTSASQPNRVIVPERLESRRLLAAVYDSGGFESPRFTTGQLLAKMTRSGPKWSMQ